MSNMLLLDDNDDDDDKNIRLLLEKLIVSTGETIASLYGT